jgi:hypothetical protein
MYSASPSPIQFRNSYITSGGKLLSDAIHLSSHHELLSVVFKTFLGPDIRVRDVSGYFDSHDHSETLDVPHLVQRWMAMTPAQRAAVIEEKETIRVEKKTQVLTERVEEALEHDHGDAPIDPEDLEAEEVDGEEEEEDGPPPSDEGSSGSDEEEEDSDEEDEDEEEDSFVVSDSCCSSEESSEEEADDESDDDD